VGRLEFTGVSDATAANYRARLNGLVALVLKARVRDVNNGELALKYVLKHPNIVSGMMWQSGFKAQTVVNNIVAILKVYESNEWIRKRWERAVMVWKMRLEQAKKRVGAEKRVVGVGAADGVSGMGTLERYKKMLADMERELGGGVHIRTHMKWLLLTLLVKSGGAIRANRDMMGCVRLTNRVGDKLGGYCGNYIALKTGEVHPEKLKAVEGLLGIVRRSVAEYPRKWLFVDSRGEPYRKANSYFKFVGRLLQDGI